MRFGCTRSPHLLARPQPTSLRGPKAHASWFGVLDVSRTPLQTPPMCWLVHVNLHQGHGRLPPPINTGFAIAADCSRTRIKFTGRNC